MNFKYTDHTISTSDCESLSCVAEVAGEARSTQVVDSVARLEEGVTIEYFHLVGSTASCHDEVICVLLKLRAVQLHWLLRRQLLIKTDGLGLLSVAEVPQLQLLVGGLLASEDEAIVNINRVAANIWSIDAPHTASTIPHVPNFDVLVPTTGHNQIRVVLDELGAENSIVMAQVSLRTWLEFHLELPGLLIVDSNLPVLSRSQEFLAVLLVISSKQLVFDVKYSV